ncbi:MAG: hypothetical protein E7099_01525 [Mediterranea massiliensis]|nr:hypothetical protein [Mediterranea massiliensis]
MKRRISIIFLLLFVATSIFAQKKQNIIVYHDNEIGKDTVISRVAFAVDNARGKQQAISLIDKDGKIIKRYKAEEIKYYIDGGQLYTSAYLMENDTLKRLLLPRIYSREDVSIYKYYPNHERSVYYVRFAGDSILKPMLVNDKNLLTDYLLTFPIAKEERVNTYIHRMKATPASFDKRYKIILSENTNYLTRFRWGILAGAGFGGVSHKIYSFENKFQGLLGAFIDVPFYNSLSFHSELAYREYTEVTHFESMGDHYGGAAIYNGRGLIMPLMVRYTANHLKGKWLPYLQIGPELHYMFKNETANQYLTGTTDGYMMLMESGTISLDKFSVGVTGGVGVEWKWQPRHSFFFDIRYTHEFSDYSQSGIYAVVSFNL